jgi:2-oxoglutarate dehydrogenase E2 component (dihydrolipoamide succinyltransferase)
VNAQLDGERLIVKGRVNLAIAVDLGHEGLVVPVVHDADELTLRGLARRIDEAVAKARENRLSSDDLEGGTYTISNNGSFGTLMTAPIINPPQVAILSTDAIRKKPVVVETEDGDAVVVRRVGVLGQSFDHRAFDGAYAAAYLHRAGEILATRDWAAEGS